MSKKDAKFRCIRWVLILQEFYFEMNEMKETKHAVAYHASRLPLDDKIFDPDETPIEQDL